MIQKSKIYTTKNGSIAVKVHNIAHVSSDYVKAKLSIWTKTGYFVEKARYYKINKNLMRAWYEFKDS